MARLLKWQPAAENASCSTSGRTRQVKAQAQADLGCWVDAEFQLRLLAVVHGETLHEQRREARAGACTKRLNHCMERSKSPTSSEGMEDQESLQPSAVISQLPDTVKDEVDDLLAHSVVAPARNS